MDDLREEQRDEAKVGVPVEVLLVLEPLIDLARIWRVAHLRAADLRQPALLGGKERSRSEARDAHVAQVILALAVPGVRLRARRGESALISADSALHSAARSASSAEERTHRREVLFRKL